MEIITNLRRLSVGTLFRMKGRTVVYRYLGYGRFETVSTGRLHYCVNYDPVVVY